MEAARHLYEHGSGSGQGQGQGQNTQSSSSLPLAPSLPKKRRDSKTPKKKKMHRSKRPSSSSSTSTSSMADVFDSKQEPSFGLRSPVESPSSLGEDGEGELEIEEEEGPAICQLRGCGKKARTRSRYCSEPCGFEAARLILVDLQRRSLLQSHSSLLLHLCSLLHLHPDTLLPLPQSSDLPLDHLQSRDVSEDQGKSLLLSGEQEKKVDLDDDQRKNVDLRVGGKAEENNSRGECGLGGRRSPSEAAKVENEKDMEVLRGMKRQMEEGERAGEEMRDHQEALLTLSRLQASQISPIGLPPGFTFPKETATSDPQKEKCVENTGRGAGGEGFDCLSCGCYVNGDVGRHGEKCFNRREARDSFIGPRLYIAADDGFYTSALCRFSYPQRRHKGHDPSATSHFARHYCNRLFTSCPLHPPFSVCP